MSKNQVSKEVISRIENAYSEWKKNKNFNARLDKAFREVWIHSAMQEAQISADTTVLALEIISKGDPIGVGLDEIKGLCVSALSAYESGS